MEAVEQELQYEMEEAAERAAAEAEAAAEELQRLKAAELAREALNKVRCKGKGKDKGNAGWSMRMR